MPKFIDLTGQRFGRLTVLRRVDNLVTPKGYRCTRWECVCDCGALHIALGSNLKNGDVTRCGNPDHYSISSYESMHSTLRYRRGRAAEFPCNNCGGPAEEWSYSCYGCADEQVTKRGQHWCHHFDHYLPRCKSCHREYDR